MMLTYVNDLELNIELMGQVVGCLEILEAAKKYRHNLYTCMKKSRPFPS